MKPVERILTNGGGLFEERGGRVLVKGTDVDLAEVWERTTEAAQEFSVSALHWALHSRGISLNLAQVLVDFVLKHPVTVEDYSVKHRVFDAHHRTAETVALPMWDSAVKEEKAETTVYRVPEGDLLDPTKPHWSLDQSLQEAREHINILHKEIDDLKQHIANLQATSLMLIGQMWTIRGILPAMLRGLVVAEPEEIDKRLAQMDEVFSGAYSEMEKAVGHITDGPLRILLDPSPELVKILSWTMAEVAAFQESA